MNIANNGGGAERKVRGDSRVSGERHGEGQNFIDRDFAKIWLMGGILFSSPPIRENTGKFE